MQRGWVMRVMVRALSVTHCCGSNLVSAKRVQVLRLGNINRACIRNGNQNVQVWTVVVLVAAPQLAAAHVITESSIVAEDAGRPAVALATSPPDAAMANAVVSADPHGGSVEHATRADVQLTWTHAMVSARAAAAASSPDCRRVLAPSHALLRPAASVSAAQPTTTWSCALGGSGGSVSAPRPLGADAVETTEASLLTGSENTMANRNTTRVIISSHSDGRSRW
jgi:hypothetical protein